MTNILDVYINNTLVGYLTKDKELIFEYDENYIKSDTFPISASLPKAITPYKGDVVEAFFQGLLPEESVKKTIARILHTDERNTFRLLEEIGTDCAGAISLYPHNFNKNDKTTPHYKKIEDNDAFDILTNLKRRPLYIGEDDFRVSGSGAQDKLVACVFDNTLYLPLNGTPSTHIIKPNIDGYNDTTYNELFCMKLAKRCGLNAPDCFIKKINNIPFYVVNRYDRAYISDREAIRIHQEDFCQILKVLPENKYESDGGPSYKDCFELLDNIGVSGRSKIAFLDLIIFNYLIGNGDAHAKNFSILYKDDTPELAPCYDLMCTVILAPHYPKAKMAMKLSSSKYLISHVIRENFSELASISGYKKSYILKRVDNMCTEIKKHAPMLKDELNSSPLTTSTVYDDIVKIIDMHCSKLENKRYND